MLTVLTWVMRCRVHGGQVMESVTMDCLFHGVNGVMALIIAMTTQMKRTVKEVFFVPEWKENAHQISILEHKELISFPASGDFLSSTDYLCKQFVPRWGLKKCQAWSGSQLFDTLMVFLKDFFEKLILKRNPQTTKKHAKFYPACNELLSWKVWQKNYENQQVIGLWSPEIAVMDGAFLSVSDAICEQRGTDLHALPCSLIWTVSVHWHIFQYPMIPSESNVGHYQPAWMCRLFRACVVHKLHKGSFSELCIMLSLLFNSEFMNTTPRWDTFSDQQKTDIFLHLQINLCCGISRAWNCIVKTLLLLNMTCPVLATV